MLALGTAAALIVISTAILLWARTRPGFDPYGWLVWGHQTVAGNLDTNAAPSWKPLPFLFTVPYGLFGHYQVWLWMITSLAVSLGVPSEGLRRGVHVSRVPEVDKWFPSG